MPSIWCGNRCHCTTSIFRIDSFIPKKKFTTSYHQPHRYKCVANYTVEQIYLLKLHVKTHLIEDGQRSGSFIGLRGLELISAVRHSI